MKKLWLLALTVALVSLYMPAFADDASSDSSSSSSSSDSMEDLNSAIGSLTNRVSTLESKGPSVEIHGFAENDVVGDDTQSFQDAPGNDPVALQGTYKGNDGQLYDSIRNTRVDFLAKAVVDGWTTKGYIEADFLGANGAADPGTESKYFAQPDLRIRHAYLEAEKDGWDFLSGQWWTLFGWNMDYVLATVEVAPVVGTTYERTEQVRVMKTFKPVDDARVQIALSAERPEQTESMVPNFDAGLRFILDSYTAPFAGGTSAVKYQPFSVGISGTFRNYFYGTATTSAVSPLVQADHNVQGEAVAVDTLIPILARDDKSPESFGLVATGEWTIGKGYGDETNNYTGPVALTNTAIGHGTNWGSANLDSGIGYMNSIGNLYLADVETWNAELQLHFPKSTGLFCTTGYGEMFSDNALAGAYNDQMCVFANAMDDLTSNVRVGLEVANFQTRYFEAKTVEPQANDHRIDLSTWYRF